MNSDDGPDDIDVSDKTSFAKLIDELDGEGIEPVQETKSAENEDQGTEVPVHDFQPPQPQLGGDGESFHPEVYKDLQSTPDPVSEIEDLDKKGITPVFERANSKERD